MKIKSIPLLFASSINQDGTRGQYTEVQKVVKFIKLKFIKMSNKLVPKDLAYVQNLIRLNADEITMMNGMVYYQLLLIV